MLALAVLGLLAVASPADTAVRVPGTTLRFGLDDTAISARGFTTAGPGARKGRCRFFGLTSDATLTFEDGRLARAEFTVDSASTYEVAYVHDQLTAMGYRKSCQQPTPKTEICDWTARTHIRLEVNGANLKASVVPASAAAVARPCQPRARRATRSAKPRPPGPPRRPRPQTSRRCRARRVTRSTLPRPSRVRCPCCPRRSR
jgi:hypothetical protein